MNELRQRQVTVWSSTLLTALLISSVVGWQRVSV